MKQKEKKVPLERYGGGMKKKRKIPAIARGRWGEDLKRTLEEIEYYEQFPHIDPVVQERIILQRKKHVQKLREKLGEIEE